MNSSFVSSWLVRVACALPVVVAGCGGATLPPIATPRAAPPPPTCESVPPIETFPIDRTADVSIRVTPDETSVTIVPLPDGRMLGLSGGRRFLVEADRILEAEVAVTPEFLGAYGRTDDVVFLGADFAVYSACDPLGPLRRIAQAPDGYSRPIRTEDAFAVITTNGAFGTGRVLRFDGHAFVPFANPPALPVIDAVFADDDHAALTLLGGGVVVTSDGGEHFTEVRGLETTVNSVTRESRGYVVQRERFVFSGGIPTWASTAVALDGTVLGEPSSAPEAPPPSEEVAARERLREYVRRHELGTDLGHRPRDATFSQCGSVETAGLRSIVSCQTDEPYGQRRSRTFVREGLDSAWVPMPALDARQWTPGADGSLASEGDCARRYTGVCVRTSLGDDAPWSAPVALGGSTRIAQVTHDLVVLTNGDGENPVLVGRHGMLPIAVPYARRGPLRVLDDGRVVLVEQETPLRPVAIHIGPADGPLERREIPTDVTLINAMTDGTIVGISNDVRVFVSLDGGANYVTLRSSVPERDRLTDGPRFRCERDRCSIYFGRGGRLDVLRNADSIPARRLAVLDRQHVPEPAGGALRCSGFPVWRSQPNGTPFTLRGARGSYSIRDEEVEVASTCASGDEGDPDCEARTRRDRHAILAWSGRDARGPFETTSLETIVASDAREVTPIVIARDHLIAAGYDALLIAKPGAAIAVIQNELGYSGQWSSIAKSNGERLVATDQMGFIRAVWLTADGSVRETRSLFGPMLGLAEVDGALVVLYGARAPTGGDITVWTESEDHTIRRWGALSSSHAPVCTGDARGARLSVDAHDWSGDALRGTTTAGLVANLRARPGEAACIESLSDHQRVLEPRSDGSFAESAASGGAAVCSFAEAEVSSPGER